MTSLLTNSAAMAALAAKRASSALLSRTTTMMSTGMRVNTAADSAAYWSISTTMRSDMGAISAVRDSLKLSSSAVDVAYTAMDQTISALDKIKAHLVMASSSESDRSTIQEDISSLAALTVSISDSATISGHNWLSTNVPDIYESTTGSRSVNLLSSFSRNDQGSVDVGMTSIDLISTSLYNVDGGGILQKDPRSPESIGGIRFPLSDGGWSQANASGGGYGFQDFLFSGPLAFGPADSMTFDITVDADDPNPATNGGISGPYDPGVQTTVTIDRSVIDAVLPGNNGVISNYQEMISVLGHALSGTGASAAGLLDPVTLLPIPDVFRVFTRESSGLDGSAVTIANLTSTVGTGGLTDFTDFGSRGSQKTLAFQSFTVYSGVEIGFDFSVNGNPPSSVQITRDFVNATLGKDNGKVETAAEMVTLLETLVGQPDLQITDNGGNQILLKTDPSQDRLNGQKTGIRFTNIAVNVEPLPAYGLQDIDIVSHPDMIADYLKTVDRMIAKATSGAVVLGSVKNRIEQQGYFAGVIMDAMKIGIGQLVDADMEDVSARLRAVQVQDQLAAQSLFIANENPKILLTLFE